MGILFLIIGALVAVYYFAHLIGKSIPSLGNWIHKNKSALALAIFVFGCWNISQGTGKSLPLGPLFVALGVSFLPSGKRFTKDGETLRS